LRFSVLDVKSGKKQAGSSDETSLAGKLDLRVGRILEAAKV